jgi:hypothetical protein
MPLENIIFNAILLTGAVGPPVLALFRLAHSDVDTATRLLWIIIIIALPLIGALGFLFVAYPRLQETSN